MLSTQGVDYQASSFKDLCIYGHSNGGASIAAFALRTSRRFPTFHFVRVDEFEKCSRACLLVQIHPTKSKHVKVATQTLVDSNVASNILCIHCLLLGPSGFWDRSPPPVIPDLQSSTRMFLKKIKAVGPVGPAISNFVCTLYTRVYMSICVDVAQTKL